MEIAVKLNSRVFKTVQGITDNEQTETEADVRCKEWNNTQSVYACSTISIYYLHFRYLIFGFSA